MDHSASAPRREKAIISWLGITQMQYRNPILMLWWSAAFPGFGHILINQYWRGTLFTLVEVILNSLANINAAMVYSFSGRADMAKQLLNLHWAYGYLIFYLYTIWDTYKKAREFNVHHELADLENARIKNFLITPGDIHILERRNPVFASFWSFMLPGLGQLYNNRVMLGVYAVFWWFIYCRLSHILTSCYALFEQGVVQSTQLLSAQWLLFMPSVLWGAVYHSYLNALENNSLFKYEQKQFLAERYTGSSVFILEKTRGDEIAGSGTV
ncbi:hypothetical protein ACFOQM_08700 [Paenibacillus sp. GCM10012307]|uniref:Uncharacterized protein n=1 Tax=Paenibacillus roseus TaxID=2798579 RepID=A0A934J138_9BACL|nr:hypothetical protein [Paenibacillus roseus]MBJ6361364.1 hypothetical protein [Paenibacillus roseus]